jgi:hypothetical protein
MHVVGLDTSFQILDFRMQASNLVHFDIQKFADPNDQHVLSVSKYPDDAIHASVYTVVLLSYLHVWILS